MHEVTCHKANSFVTLTYAPEHLPENGQLNRQTLTLFLKRLRKMLGARKIKYYACGEYGELNLRPHYHMILFGVHPIKDRPVLEKAWQLGFVHTGTVTPDSAKYVADYTNKSEKIQADRKVLQEAADLGIEMVKPFNTQSLGIGKQYALDNAEQFQQTLRAYIKGVPVSLPRYYIKILEIDPKKIQKLGNQKRTEEAEEWARKGFSGVRKRIEKWDWQLQKEANTASLISKTRKGKL